MANLQDYDYVPVLVERLVDGQIVELPGFLRVALSSGCATVAGVADSTDFVDTIDAAPPGYQLKTRVCPQLDDIVVTADIADFTPDDTTPITPDPGSQSPQSILNSIIYTSTSNDDGGPVTP